MDGLGLIWTPELVEALSLTEFVDDFGSSETPAPTRSAQIPNAISICVQTLDNRPARSAAFDQVESSTLPNAPPRQDFESASFEVLKTAQIRPMPRPVPGALTSNVRLLPEANSQTPRTITATQLGELPARIVPKVLSNDWVATDLFSEKIELRLTSFASTTRILPLAVVSRIGVIDTCTIDMSGCTKTPRLESW